MSSSFSVLTPCYNARLWIPACIASVADQTGVTVEHLVEDGASTDGTAEYVLSAPHVKAVSEPDKGMYDAINKAWDKCTGEFVVHLNADEELLPGALSAVAAYFKASSLTGYPGNQSSPNSELRSISSPFVLCRPQVALRS